MELKHLPPGLGFGLRQIASWLRLGFGIRARSWFLMRNSLQSILCFCQPSESKLNKTKHPSSGKLAKSSLPGHLYRRFSLADSEMESLNPHGEVMYEEVVVSASAFNFSDYEADVFWPQGSSRLDSFRVEDSFSGKTEDTESDIEGFYI
ncbi:hypothetical protein V6N13_052395 [Hibiscus sabdariffa]